jgi:transcription elongation factor Elf1
VSLKRITKERAERIAKGHACENCGEYTYKKVSVKPATKSQHSDLGIAWAAEKICGVCGAHHEMGISAEGDIVYVS